MAKGSARKVQLIPEAHRALDQMKYEIAAELGLPVRQGSEDYWGDIPARECGKVGGEMVRRMIAFAQQNLVQATQAAGQRNV